MPVKKTWGREVVFLAVLSWLAVTYKIFFGMKPADAVSFSTMYGALTTTVWLTVAGVYSFKGVSGGVNKRLGGADDLSVD